MNHDHVTAKLEMMTKNKKPAFKHVWSGISDKKSSGLKKNLGNSSSVGLTNYPKIVELKRSIKGG